MALRDRTPESDFRGYFSDTETKLDEGNTAISRHFERGPLWYALETDWLAGHVRLELRNVGAKYPFESSHGFPRIQPNSGDRDV